ncbi:MAG TPA: SDR family NAD(P)-dependent oxidoreductase [Candidatus Binatia bacterium]|nr:SDR family NAD(P)-dependent oxidoreductase [Candidatus Binatia bacterium]
MRGTVFEKPGTALITGASAGIGTELARAFAERGHDLVLVARSGDRLEALAAELEAGFGIDASFIVSDLTEPGAPDDVFAEVCGAGIQVDVLVNNAGAGSFARFAEVDLDRHLRILQLNVVALTALTRLFVEPMVRRGSGRVLNVSSVAGFQPMPMLAVYGATKAFIISLSEALAVELQGTGVTITVLCPGFTGTGLIEDLQGQAGDPDMIPGLVMQDPAVVAREGVEACLCGKPLHINGLGYQLGVLWETWQPRWLIRSMGSTLTRMMTARPRAGKE